MRITKKYFKRDFFKQAVAIFFLLIVDILAILLSIIVAVSFRKFLGLFIIMPEISYDYVFFNSVYVTLLFMFLYLGIYNKRYDFWHESRLIFKASFLSFFMLLAGLALGQNAQYYSRTTLFFIFVFCTFFIPLLKLIAKNMLFRFSIWQKRAKVFSSNKDFKHEIFFSKYLGYIVADNKYYETVFIDSSNIDKDKLNKIIESHIKNSREIIFTPVLNSYDFSHSSIYNLLNSRTNVFTLENELLKPRNIIMKTIIDYCIVIVTLPIWFPIFLLIITLIKKEEFRERVFFTQKRIGVDGKEFTCYKFRTMYADQSFMAEWLESNPDEKEYYDKYHKYMNDPRITKIGHFLRKTSLDELPQLLNVLKGEMSLVGPRPYMVEEITDVGNRSILVFAVKPGITGLWQVSGRSDIDFSTRVEIDVWYMKNWSLWNDIAILFKTINVVLKRDGAY